MKAVILSAGLGTRLRPLTEKIPKPLVPLAGKPLLQYHLDHLYKHGVKEVLINTHYFPQQIESFISKYQVLNPEIKIQTTFEPILLGSAGTVQVNRNFFANETCLVVYGDNLTNIHYGNFLRSHKNLGSAITIAVYHEPNPETKGIVEFDDDLRVKKFVEKPQPDQITTHWANAGIYLLEPHVLEKMGTYTEQPLDFGFHVFPQLLDQGEFLRVYPFDEYLLDIGTPESYNKAQEIINSIEF